MNKYSVEVKYTKASEFLVEASSLKEAKDFVREEVLRSFDLYVELVNRQSHTSSTKG
jgi:hypothetical protein